MGGYWLGGNDNLIEDATLTSSSQKAGIIGMAVKKAGTGSGVAYTDNPGSYTGVKNLIYTVEIDSIAGGAEVAQATFRWKHSDSTGWEASGVATSTTFTTLEKGVKIKWASGAGADFVVGDQWTIQATAIYGLANLYALNRDDVFRTSALGSPSWIKANMGSAKNVKAIVILDHNFTSGATITLKANTVDSYASEEDETGATGFKVSLINGTAFFQAEGLDLSSFVGKFIRLIDSAGKVADGWIKAAGGGETLGAELIVNGELTVDTAGWSQTNYTMTRHDSGGASPGADTWVLKGLSTAATGRKLYQTIVASVGIVVKCTHYYYVVAGDPDFYTDLGSLLNLTTGNVKNAWTARARYACVINLNPEFRAGHIDAGGAIGDDVYIDAISIKQVTDCAVTGIKIVTASGGATYNWTSIESGFNPNDAAMTFDIYAGDPDVWSNPAYSQALTWTTEKIVYFLNQTYQWWRLDVTDAANPAGYIEISELYLGVGITPSIAVEDGPRRIIDLTVPEWKEREAYQAQITCYNTATKATVRSLIEGLREDNRIRPFFWCTNYSSPSANTWLMELRTPQISEDRAGKDHFRIGLDLIESRKSDV